MPVSWPMYCYAKRLDKPSALRPKVCGTPSLPSPLYFIYTPNLPILYYGSQSQLSLLLSTTSTPESSLIQLPPCSWRRKTQENNLVFTLDRVFAKPRGNNHSTSYQSLHNDLDQTEKNKHSHSRQDILSKFKAIFQWCFSKSPSFRQINEEK